jgi:hypothetical protein
MLSAAEPTSNANNGTNNGVTSGTGQFDGGARFSGSSQYMDVGNGSSLQVTGRMTIEAWVEPTDFANNDGLVEDHRQPSAAAI